MLPEPGLKIVEKYEAPGGETEKLTALLWSEVLGIEENIIGLDSNFFELGGHSLKATQLVSVVRKAFNVKLPLAEIFKRPTVRELSAWLRKAAEHQYVSIAAAELKDYYAVSSAQKRLYILQEMNEAGIGYNIPAIYRLEGCIDKDRLERTFKGLIKRHESLRTSFARVGGKPFQVVHEGVEFEIEYYCTKRGVNEIIRDFIRPFDLAGAPLMRVGLMRIDNLEHMLMVDMHHIITDGRSMGILIREFMKLYSFPDADEELPPLPVQYKDFSEWLHSEPQGKLTREQEAYWLREFEGEIPVLDLLTDYPRGRERNIAGSVVYFKLGEKETRDLRQLAKEEDVTMYMLLLAIYNVFLSRLSSQEEIIVGTPAAGRRHADLGPLIGMFVNTLALRNYPGENKTFREFLQEIKERTLAAFENQDYPFEDLAEKVADNRDASRNPLFDVMFTMQNLGLPELEIPGVRLKPYGYETPAAKFDLVLTGIETGDHMDFRFEYDTSLFKEEIIIDFANYYNEIIAAVSEDRDIKLSQIDLSGLLEVNVDENITQEINGEFEF
jgi:acyl carrier protein